MRGIGVAEKTLPRFWSLFHPITFIQKMSVIASFVSNIPHNWELTSLLNYGIAMMARKFLVLVSLE